MTKELDCMLTRFPDHRGFIMGLYDADTDFRALCEDYWHCRHSISQLLRHPLPDHRIISNYNLLQADLEHEALLAIDRKRLSANQGTATT